MYTLIITSFITDLLSSETHHKLQAEYCCASSDEAVVSYAVTSYYSAFDVLTDVKNLLYYTVIKYSLTSLSTLTHFSIRILLQPSPRV